MTNMDRFLCAFLALALLCISLISYEVGDLRQRVEDLERIHAEARNG